MAVVGKNGPEDELNCSGCGYDSCRDFAIAMLEGRAEENMCVSYMRKIAHDKATVLLQKIPAGVLLVNAELKVMDMNQRCAALMGEDIASIYEVDPGLYGVDLKNICSFEDLFRAVLTTGKEITERSDPGGRQNMGLVHLQHTASSVGIRSIARLERAWRTKGVDARKDAGSDKKTHGDRAASGLPVRRKCSIHGCHLEDSHGSL